MIASLAILTLLAYARVWTFGLVYDDANWLPVVTPAFWSSWPYWCRAPWHLAAWIGGGLPWAFHGLVLGLHLLNGGLVYLLARRWLSVPAAVLALTLFWLHPLQVEAVAYVSGGIEVLLTTYVLIALIGGLSDRPLGWLLGGVSLFLAATMKVSALPVLLVVPVFVMAARGASWRLLPAALVGLALVGWPAITTWGLRIGSLAGRLSAVNALAYAVGRYLALVVWPVGFSIEHTGDPSLAPWVALGALAVGMVAWTVRQRWAAPAVAWAWIAALLLPRALVVHEASPLTEHHTYLPFLAVWLTAGSAVDRFVLVGGC